MTIFPTPNFGRGSGFQGEIRFLALASSYALVDGEIRSDMQPRASFNGREWQPITLLGDIAQVGRSTGFGAFVPKAFTEFKGVFYLFGSLFRSTSGARAVAFTSTDKKTWMLADTPLQTAGEAIYPEAWVAIAQNDDYLAAVQPGGQLVWTDGVSWYGRDNLPLDPPTGPRVRAMTATPAGFVIIGIATISYQNRVLAAPNPQGTWDIQRNVFDYNPVTLLAAGDAVVGFATYPTTVSQWWVGTTPLNDLTGWDLEAFAPKLPIDFAIYGGGKWFAGGQNAWVTAAGYLSAWEVPSETPWGGSEGRPRSGYYLDGVWYIHFNNGDLAFSDDGATWQRQLNTGLADLPYVATIAFAKASLDFTKPSNSQYVAQVI